MQSDELGRSVTKARAFSPGYLFKPFRWAAPAIAAMVQSNPKLIRHLFEIDRPRMHLIGLALAHLDADTAVSLAELLLTASTGEILRCALGRPPVGTKRVLRHLPFAMLRPDDYLKLVQLLKDPLVAKLLHHLNDGDITETTIRVLYNVPAPLRPVLSRVVPHMESLEHLSEGLQWLAARSGIASFDIFVADLAKRRQPGQFIARIKELIACLPLPESLPPAQIGRARRIDTAAEIRLLAKEFKNCLANYTSQIDEGMCAIYLWPDPAMPALCQVKRHGRLGWCLGQILGPENVELEDAQLDLIVATFGQIAIPRAKACYALEWIMRAEIKSRAPTRQEREQVRQLTLEELEQEAWQAETEEVA